LSAVAWLMKTWYGLLPALIAFLAADFFLAI
jgi:hypothetical protein